MPIEREVSVRISTGVVVAALVWIISGGLLAWGTYTDRVDTLAWGLAFVGVAVTCQVRHYFARQNRIFRNAFELGRDAGPREVGEPTPLRRP